MKFRTLYLILITTLLVSCGEGYEEIDGQWTWVLHSESGKHILEIKADNSTFEILDDKKYAKDKNTVFWEGVEIENADPKTFKVVTDNGYSKDENYVFLDNDIVIFADPNTFEIIKGPYSKDNKRIFNGNLPMNVKKIEEFEITKYDGGNSSTIKSYFIKRNKDYEWLDTLNVKGIIVDESAEARTKTEKFKGFRKVE